jgi:hypothetical protein
MMGCAGALVGWLRPGQAVAADDVVVLDDAARVAERIPAASAPFAAQAARHGVRVITGAIASQPGRPDDAGLQGGGRARQRARWWSRWRAARWRPSHATGASRSTCSGWCSTRPARACRSGPDVIDEQTGGVHIGRAIRELAPPSRWPEVVRLVRGQRAAARTLGELAQVIADEGLPEAALSRRTATA